MKKKFSRILFVLFIAGIFAFSCALDENNNVGGKNDGNTITTVAVPESSSSSAAVVVESSSSSAAIISSSSSSISSEITSSISSSSSSNPFGETTGVSDPKITATIYSITKTDGTATTNDFSSTPASTSLLYSKSINVPIMGYSDGFPGATNLTQYFGIQYNATIVAPVTGTYYFLVVCDDGASMAIGGTALSFTKLGKTSGSSYWEDYTSFLKSGYTGFGTTKISQYRDKTKGTNMDSQHVAGMYIASINLVAGQSYSFVMKYFQGPKDEIACTVKVVLPGASSSVLFDMDNFK